MIKRKPAVAAYKFRIGSNIRKWRNMKDIKQKDLARTLNVSEAAISNIENDVANITVTQLEDIAIALNVSVEQLLSDPHQKLKMPFPQATYLNSKENVHTIDREFLDAIIASMEKKDQQLQLLLQQFIQVTGALLKHELPLFNQGSREASRA